MRYTEEQLWSHWWAPTRVFLSELMAAVRINGFANGQEATGRLLWGLFTIAAIGRHIKSTAGGRVEKERNDTDALIS